MTNSTSSQKVQKFRVAFSREELVTLAKSLESNTDSILENAALILSLKKAIRKIDFQILEPAFSSLPESSKPKEMLLAEIGQKAIASLAETYKTQPFLLSLDQQGTALLAIVEADPTYQMTEAEKSLFNKAMARKMGFE